MRELKFSNQTDFTKPYPIVLKLHINEIKNLATIRICIENDIFENEVIL